MPIGLKKAPSTRNVVARLLGEFLREMAVLIVVFAPLDVIVQNKSKTSP